jgi:hypothetical protein
MRRGPLLRSAKGAVTCAMSAPAAWKQDSLMRALRQDPTGASRKSAVQSSHPAQCDDDRQPGGAGHEPAGDEGALRGAPHAGIQVTLGKLVVGAGGGRGQPHCQHQGQRVPGGCRGPGRDHVAGERRERDHGAYAQLEDVEYQGHGRFAAVAWRDAPRRAAIV